METMTRPSWTDERLDDFRENVDRRFDRVEGDIREMRQLLFAMVGIMITGFLSLAGLILFHGS
jgi:hypothetical protein